MTANKRRFSWGAVLLVLLAMCLVYYLASGLRSQDAVSYAQVRQLFLDEKVQEFAISDTGSPPSCPTAAPSAATCMTFRCFTTI